MSSQRYTASMIPTKDGTAWVVSFRHPLRKDARGKQGRKIRRGLGTDKSKALRLLEQMNTLLGDSNWHSIAKRNEAERKFDPAIIRAFYDDIETTPYNSSNMRESVLPLPTSQEGYTKVMLVGTTGAGKTSVLRQLIGTHPDRDRFPSTSASRTTISDIEVITSEEPLFEAVVTFSNEWAIHTNIHECVANATAAIWEDQEDEKLAMNLLTHRDLRFRLGYIIGSYRQTAASIKSQEDDWNFDEDEQEPTDDIDESDGSLPTDDDLGRMHHTLKSYLDRIRVLAKQAKNNLETDLDTDLNSLIGKEKEAAQDIFEDIVQSLPDFDELVNDIMDEVKVRFERVTVGNLNTLPNGWASSWHYRTLDRAEFVRTVRRFSSNFAPAFGTLLTPLVDGIRIKGSFFPAFTDRRPKLVILDGEGLGHVEDQAAGIPSRISNQFENVDVILLVDSAKAPMLEAPATVIRAVAASGYQHKLAIAFTHFDLMRGQANLPTFSSQRSHVLSTVYQKIANLKEVVGAPAVRAIEKEIDGRSFMLGFLDKYLTSKQRGPVKEFMTLLDMFESSIEPVDIPEATPVYDTAGLILTIQSATTDFRTRWDAILGFKPSGIIRTPHWSEVKALNRRIVLEFDNSEYKDLKPVPDFVARLAESITRYLANPHDWKSSAPSEDEADEAISRVQRAVFHRLHEFVESRLLRVPRQKWFEAYEYKGRGSTIERARAIQNIYESSVPIPGPVLAPNSEKFLREVRTLIHETIQEGGGELVSNVLGISGQQNGPEIMDSEHVAGEDKVPA